MAEGRTPIPLLSPPSAVDRHHKDGNPANNVAENIASLCRRCHMQVDGRLRSV